MLIPTNLIADPQVIEGLANGSLVRFGSVIRHASGTPQGGEIFRHLLESPDLTSTLMNAPFNPVLPVADMTAKAAGISGQLTQLGSTTSQILGLTQITAGASVLNLGVSVAGFLYMNHRLNQLQGQISEMSSLVEQGFSTIGGKLDRMQGQLAYLCLMMENNQVQQQQLKEGLARLHQAFLIKTISELQSELYSLRLFPEELPKNAIKASESARIFLCNQANQTPIEFTPQSMMIADVATQGWAVATATEAHLLLRHGRIDEAEEILNHTVPLFKNHCDRWGSTLIKTERSELSTAYRFEAPMFRDYISPERLARIIKISPDDQDISIQKREWKRQEAFVEFEMTRTKPNISRQWIYSQIALSEFLDTLSELSDRLDGLREFAKLCKRSGVKNCQELLPESGESGLYTLPNV